MQSDFYPRTGDGRVGHYGNDWNSVRTSTIGTDVDYDLSSYVLLGVAEDLSYYYN